MSDWRVEIPALDARGLRIGVVASRFNAEITDALLDGALDWLREAGADAARVRVVRVPGALELPTVAAAMADRGFEAIVCLGCVIRGETDHYEHVCRAAIDGIARVAARGVAGVGNGVLTVHTVEQARARIGGAHGHKGREAAAAAVEVARVLRALRGEGS